MTLTQIAIIVTMATFYAAAIYVFHLQIINEEEYLTSTFGDEYIRYKRQVRRYL